MVSTMNIAIFVNSKIIVLHKFLDEKCRSRTEKVAKSNEMSITCRDCSINFHVPQVGKRWGVKNNFFRSRTCPSMRRPLLVYTCVVPINQSINQSKERHKSNRLQGR